MRVSEPPKKSGFSFPAEDQWITYAARKKKGTETEGGNKGTTATPSSSKQSKGGHKRSSPFHWDQDTEEGEGRTLLKLKRAKTDRQESNPFQWEDDSENEDGKMERGRASPLKTYAVSKERGTDLAASPQKSREKDADAASRDRIGNRGSWSQKTKKDASKAKGDD